MPPTIVLPIPKNTAFVGVTFYTQFLVVDPVNALNIIVSNAGKGVIGSL